MNKVSDLKLFLPQSSYLLNSYRKTKHHDTYPVITAVWPRNYPLSPKEQKLLKQLSQQNTETKIEIIQTNKRRPFSLRQRTKEGPWYLDYSLYVGASQTTRKNKKLVSFVS